MPKPQPKPSGDSPAVDKCVEVFNSLLHMPDCSPVFAAMGAIVANYFQGDPVWLMLVGAPSTGKTVVVKTCSHLPDCRQAPNSHNASAFLTWDSKRGMGGLLSPPRTENGMETGGIGSFGIITYPEFTSVLSLPPDARAFVSSVHREIYDGKWLREFGSNGGNTLPWEGKAGALGAVTPAIDRHTMSAELGERWLYYRFPPPDHIAQANAAGRNHSEDPMDRNATLAAAVLDVFHSANIERGEIPRSLTDKERWNMSRTVKAACLLRGTVARDAYHRDIIDLPQTEGPGRMHSALTSILLALERLGLRKAWQWKTIRRIAFHSAPALRLEFVRLSWKLQQVGHPITVNGIRPMLPFSNGVLSRLLEDLKMLRILTHDGDEEWRLDEGIRKVLEEMQADL